MLGRPILIELIKDEDERGPPDTPVQQQPPSLLQRMGGVLPPVSDKVVLQKPVLQEAATNAQATNGMTSMCVVLFIQLLFSTDHSVLKSGT